MMFELLLDLTDRFLNLRDTNAECAIALRAHLHESYRTLRDGCFGWHGPRHFVPGYDRTVPPGRKPFAQRRASH